VSIVGDPVVAVTVARGVPPPAENGNPVSNGLIVKLSFIGYANFAD
jgi:hypothetical protein